MESNGLINVYTRDKLWLCAIMSRIFCFMKRKFLPNIYIHTRTIKEYELNKVTVAAKFIIIVTYWIDTELINHVTAAELCILFCCNLIHWLLESQMLLKWCNLFILFRSNRFFPFQITTLHFSGLYIVIGWKKNYRYVIRYELLRYELIIK